MIAATGTRAGIMCSGSCFSTGAGRAHSPALRPLRNRTEHRAVPPSQPPPLLRAADAVVHRHHPFHDGCCPRFGVHAFDKRVVNLDGRDREFFQVAERRVSAAEVVDGHADSKFAQPGDLSTPITLLERGLEALLESECPHLYRIGRIGAGVGGELVAAPPTQRRCLRDLAGRG
jgi:hypothetical protein